jgi:hypothetical protein
VCFQNKDTKQRRESNEKAATHVGNTLGERGGCCHDGLDLFRRPMIAQRGVRRVCVHVSDQRRDVQ